uniref:Iso_dh domain-containing protein n=1 Tax=Rhabditophanes sp. KR3021 TaxID=114890 RepID=A0AC35TZ88_9BILA
MLSRLPKTLSFANTISRNLTSTQVLSIHTERDRFRSPILKSKNASFASYGGRHTVTAIPGDGIGPEMLEIVKRIFNFCQVPVDFEDCQLTSNPNTTETELENAIVSIKRNGVGLKGSMDTDYRNPLSKSINLELRRRLDLYANVVHCVSVPTIPSRHSGVNVVVVRENTEGEYSGHEHEAVPGVVESLKICTRVKLERICRFAFEYALIHGRKKVTAVHKANIQKVSDGLFLSICTEMAKAEYPQIEFEAMIVDNASMQLVSNPSQFDIMVMPNLYGNILCNIACGIVGGPGLVSGMNIGHKYAVFESGTRNTGMDLIGKNKANPTAFIRAGVDMIRYIGLHAHANIISDALYDTLCIKTLHTEDIGGTTTTSQFVDVLLEKCLEAKENYRDARN